MYNFVRNYTNKQISLMIIKILGTGCTKCNTLEKHTLKALEKANIEATVNKVDDIVEIMQYGVMTTPALVIDDKVAVKGKVPSVEDIVKLITK